MKIALIIDKSQVYIDLQKELIMAEWELETKDTKRMKSLLDAGAPTLFGESPAGIIHLEDIVQVKRFVEDMTAKIKKNTMESTAGKGLIVYTTVGRNSTRKLEKLFTDLDGKVIVSKVDSKSTMSAAARLIADMGFSKDVRDYMLNYVGQDYEALIPIVRSFSDLTKTEQRQITLAEIYIRLPQAPGSVPPWDIEKPLLEGQTTEMLKIFRRVHQSTDLLVVLFILKNKFQLSYRAGVLAESGLSQSRIAEVLDVKDNYPLKLAIQNARNFGTVKLQAAVELLANLETAVKGGSATPNDVEMEVKLIELQSILRNR